MPFAVGMAKAVQRVIFRKHEFVARDEHRARSSQRNITVVFENRARARGGSRVVARADGDLDVRPTEFVRELLFQGSQEGVAFAKPRQFVFVQSANFKHFARPAFVCNVQKKCSRRVRIIGYELARKHIHEVVFRQHYFVGTREIFGLVIFQPKYFRRGEARERDIARPLGQFFKAVQIGGFLEGSAVVPEYAGADNVTAFIQRDKSVHLPADRNSFYVFYVQPRQCFYRRFEPVGRVLFAVTLFGVADLITFALFGEDCAACVRGDYLDRRSAQIYADINIFILQAFSPRLQRSPR